MGVFCFVRSIHLFLVASCRVRHAIPRETHTVIMIIDPLVASGMKNIVAGYRRLSDICLPEEK